MARRGKVTTDNFNRTNRGSLFKNRNFNKKKENMTKSEKLMNGVATWCSFYRMFPHVFVKDYFGIDLKPFQKILIYHMMKCTQTCYIASRGQGKTWLTAIFICVRCILFPETKVVIASGQLQQSIEVLEKIQELMNNSSNLTREIREIRIGRQNAGMNFINGSWVKVVASNDGARGKRGNLLILDEFRMIDKTIVDTVLKKFLSAPRQPNYLKKEEYKHLKEPNKQIYLTSAYFKSNWSWEKTKAFFKSMTDGKSYFLCSLPYQMALKEELLMREAIEEEMSESDFNEITWSMEMGALFYGSSDKAWFDFEELNQNRVVKEILYPKSFYKKYKNLKGLEYKPKVDGEIRLLTCDIAIMETTSKRKKSKNDNSVYSLIRLIPNNRKTAYKKYVSYVEAHEGGNTTVQALRIRKLYDEFDCDYIVLDTQSGGIGVYDNLVTNLYDKEENIEYEALSCCNDADMASRCMIDDAPKAIWSMKAYEQINNDMHIYVKDDLKQGKLRLLVNEIEGKDFLKEIKGFESLPLEKQAELSVPYYQTAILVNEMLALENVGKDGKIKLKEPSGGRKDRYSSLGYGVYVSKLLEREKLRKDEENKTDWNNAPMFVSSIKLE